MDSLVVETRGIPGTMENFEAGHFAYIAHIHIERERESGCYTQTNAFLHLSANYRTIFRFLFPLLAFLIPQVVFNEEERTRGNTKVSFA